MAFIYAIKNDMNDKLYVGKTLFSLDKRFKEHVQDSRRSRCEKRPLYNAMRKYGTEHFWIEELEKCSAEESASREEAWIKELGTYEYGYNATRGGDSKHYYDYPVIARKYLELKSEKETVNFFDCDVQTVKVACKECGVEIYSSTEVKRAKYSKPVAAYDKDTGKEIKSFSSVPVASLWVKEQGKSISPKIKHKIHLAARGKAKTAYGYVWHYV